MDEGEPVKMGHFDGNCDKTRVTKVRRYITEVFSQNVHPYIHTCTTRCSIAVSWFMEKKKFKSIILHFIRFQVFFEGIARPLLMD